VKKFHGEQFRPTLALILGLVISVAQPLSFSLAQPPTSITSSGLNTQISAPSTLPNGQVNYNITGGTRPGNGPNLFHSFGQFSVGTNNIANFLNDTGLPTSNILARVTGGNISNIFGTIQTTGFGNANLFLMNPAGFLFGPTAMVNVGGMVAFTSANYLRLADAVRFNATPKPAADMLLSAAPIAAFGFLGSNPGAIIVQGSQLSVAPGTGLSLVGGNITIQSGTLQDGTVQPARLSVPSGQVNLVSVDKPSNQKVGGEVVVNGAGPASGLVPTGFNSLGTIALTQGSTIDTSGAPIVFGGGAGGVSIRGGQFVMDDSSITALHGILSGSLGQIEVTANTVSISNQSSIRTGSTVPCCGFGPAENISLNADTLSVSNSTIGNGGPPGGNYTPGAITIQGLGGAGSSAKQVTLTNSQLSATGGQDGFLGGPITILAKDVTLNHSGLNTFSFDGIGGPITIIAGRQIQSEGSELSSSAFFGIGGRSTLQAGDKINLSNTGISANSSSGFSGGNVTMSAPVISVSGGAIQAIAGAAGGKGGNINIQATKEVRLTDGAIISADSFNSSFPGNISINAGARFVSDNSTISAQGNGGTIHVQADQKIKLTDSTLTTSVAGGPGTVGGAITLDSNVVKLQNSQILSTATEGHGGTVNITATKRLVEDATSVISATSATGPNGSVTITAPRTILNGVVEP
jgi:filamentous hemagglutinin family protein